MQGMMDRNENLCSLKGAMFSQNTVVTKLLRFPDGNIVQTNACEIVNTASDRGSSGGRVTKPAISVQLQQDRTWF